MLDISTLTLGEVATVERLAGLPISAIADDESPKGLALAALCMVTAKRNGRPDFTFTDAQALTLEDANALLGLTDDEPPTTPAELEGVDEHPPA